MRKLLHTSGGIKGAGLSPTLRLRLSTGEEAMKQAPAEATMRNCHGSAIGIFAINGEEDVNLSS
jgi:hypothetical protein